MRTLGFIIIRHVRDEPSGKFWIKCYESIRNFYPENLILIIDDNSDHNYIENISLYNTLIIQSEYHGRGELLPYYYYAKHKLFDMAFILHDSTIVNSKFNIDNIFDYKIIFSFEHGWDTPEAELKMLEVFNNSELIEFYKNKNLWKGCFGCMSVITHDYISYLNEKYDFSKLLPVVLNRNDRCCFERIVACLLQINVKHESLLGDIHAYMDWGTTYDNVNNYTHLPLIKHWYGR